MLVSQTKLHLNISYGSPLKKKKKKNFLGRLEMLTICPKSVYFMNIVKKMCLFHQVTDHMKNSFFQRKYMRFENGL